MPVSYRAKRKKTTIEPAALVEAIRYGEIMGWRTFPAHTPISNKCSCKLGIECGSNAGKHPRIVGWQQEATTDPDQLRKWWKKWPDANVGLATGAASGVFIVDIDPRSGGIETLGRLEDDHGPLPHTPEQITGGGGRQIFFRHPGRRVKNGAHVLGPGVDVRGDGGLVILPPSLHKSGRCYEWELSSRFDEVELTDAPDWILGLVRGEEGQSVTQIEECNTSSFCVTPDIQGAILATLPDGIGHRNRCLFNFARRLRGMPQLAGATADDLRGIVAAWFNQALPNIGTKRWLTSWHEFAYAWARINHAHGQGPMRDAMKAADAASLPAFAKRYREPSMRRLINLCCELQRRGGDKFHLACRAAAEQIEVDHMTASRYLRRLVYDGVLVLVMKGARGRATEYRYEPPITQVDKPRKPNAGKAGRKGLPNDDK